mmetsp:Transcript_58590/g.152515  ORF Transcript_58590/g.152515 Transcript_58590/m.152515 type:complete len:145 (-) Transcript_58590:618-1052(-)
MMTRTTTQRRLLRPPCDQSLEMRGLTFISKPRSSIGTPEVDLRGFLLALTADPARLLGQIRGPMRPNKMKSLSQTVPAQRGVLVDGALSSNSNSNSNININSNSNVGRRRPRISLLTADMVRHPQPVECDLVHLLKRAPPGVAG